MKINYKKILNLRRLASSPKQLFATLVFILVVIFIQNYIAKNPSYEAKVIRVIDGDTIEILDGENKKRARLYGIDAPELKQAYGEQSKRFLGSLIDRKNVEIIQKDKDKYGRILAIIKLEGKDINQIMVKSGFAWAYIYYSDSYLNEEKEARAKKIGLWKDENPTEPYKWRKKNRF